MAKPPENNTLEDFPPQLRRTLEDSLEGMSFLQQLTQDVAAKIPEPLFVEHLLPILANRDGRQSLVRWQQVAGSVMRPLDVYDPRDSKVLFRVPAILRQLNDTVINLSGRSTYEIIATVEKKRQIIPAIGDRYLQAHLTNRIEGLPANVKDVLAWNAILVRYGYPPLFKTLVEQPDALSNETPSSNTLDYEGFDDL
jgi:hypothetical protein